jgi:hypothetical protein
MPTKNRIWTRQEEAAIDWREKLAIGCIAA